ncbi:hypothetical protein [Actinomadura rubrisoli]|uniref:Protein kinase n=1 Tax=Actinomadura rubrisoli TaxID=2530368 RepID=A0A4R5BCQ8_9ACTN|nr:hypothetical protein [Actinomadura rubrisoli]TDD83951.1 hypothetical protein E1298_20630 [Actinomadura rubrisoli]
MSAGLPGPEFTALIRPHTGDVTGVRPTSRGNNSAVTAIVECENGPFFVKAVPNRPGGRRDSLVREGLVNPYVRSLSPASLWKAEDQAWIALGFEVVDGRSADFTPGSADLPAIIDIINRIGVLDLPEIAHDWPETRWDRFATDADRFQGRSLLYTDINPDNLLIGDGATWAVDWSWPTRGAAFIDPACLVVQLVAAGHSPQAAETWAAHCPAWTNADPQAISAFATANRHMYRRFADRSPDAPWLAAMATSAQQWADYRDSL